jgi:hypothetical protein
MRKTKWYLILVVFVLFLIGIGAYFMDRQREMSARQANDVKIQEIQDIADAKEDIAVQSAQKPDSESKKSEENIIKPAKKRESGPENLTGTIERISRPAARYLNHETGKYRWSTSVFAVHRSTYSGDMNTVIDKVGEMLVIPAETRPGNSFYIVREKNSDKIGFYTNKIIVVSGKEVTRKIIEESGRSYDFIAGSYVIAVPEIQEAIDLVAQIKTLDPDAQVDLDTSFDAVRPK